MSARNDAIDILIEDLALQVLSAHVAVDQTEDLRNRLESVRTVVRRRKSASPLEAERALVQMTTNVGERLNETRALAGTLEWDLRYYLARRNGRGKVVQNRKSTPPAGARRK